MRVSRSVPVYVSVGSNVDREANIRRAVASLRARYGELTVSGVYESAPVGFDGDDFYNLVVRFETDETLDRVSRRLRSIEASQRRDRLQPRFGPRTIDLDLLLYGNQIVDAGSVRVPRREITQYGFVLGPLAEIAADEHHPVSGARYGDLWAQMANAERVRVRRVDHPRCP